MQLPSRAADGERARLGVLLPLAQGGEAVSAVKHERMWAVVAPDGKLDPYCVMRLRKDCIDAATLHCPWHWPELRKAGFTVRRVTVTIDPTETESANNNAPGALVVEDETASALMNC